MRNRRPLRGSQRVTLSAMTVALSLVCLYVASLLPGGSPALYFVASVLTAGLVLEGEGVLAILVYIATSALAIFLVPNKLMTAPYIAMTGHYCVYKLFIERRVNSRLVQLIPKLVYMSAFTALAVWLCGLLFGYDALANLPVPLWAAILLALVILVAYDWLLTYTIRFYDVSIRPMLIGKRGR